MCGSGFVFLFVCNARLILCEMQMVEDGIALMKLEKVELGDGVHMNKRGTLKWSCKTKSKLSYQLINLGRFVSLFPTCVGSCVFLPLDQWLPRAMHYVFIMFYEGLVLRCDDNTRWSSYKNLGI